LLNLFSRLCRTRGFVVAETDATLPSPRVLPATMARCDNVSQPDPGLSCAWSLSMPFLNGGWRP